MSSPAPPPKPKTYLLTSCTTPLGHLLTQTLLGLNLQVAACCTRSEFRSPLLTPLLQSYPTQLTLFELDAISPATCQSAIAAAVVRFGRVDAVVHTGVCSTVVGALEELGATDVAASFEDAYFGRVNVVKAAVAAMRKQQRGSGGHIVVVTGLTAAMGTPALSLRCAADHAIEGLLDGLAFEVAPFNIRVSVVQPPVEVALWGMGEAKVAEELNAYKEVEGGERVGTVRRMAEMMARDRVQNDLLEDTVRIIVEIAGTENPPGRITVGEEAVEVVKDRLKTLSEELEECLDASLAADINAPPGVGGTGGRTRPVTSEVGEE
jgi:NAD(P)-dependent dehydrogenase (short-subunit alcohol dehydrogenase family)